MLLKKGVVLGAVVLVGRIASCDSFASSRGKTVIGGGTTSTTHSPNTNKGNTQQQQQQPVGNVLILDHLNINHEKGRHDLLKSFYFDFLQCAVDPRKEENLTKGKKTLWANIGSHQFHLPEGKPNPQVLQGLITLEYPNIEVLKNRYEDLSNSSSILKDSRFNMEQQLGDDEALLVTDPWGTMFRITKSSTPADSRGRQPGPISEGLGMKDLTLYASANANIRGIARFYDQVMGAPVLEVSEKSCILSVGPQQTLTFEQSPTTDPVQHEDLIFEGPIEGRPDFDSNFGPHISMYVANLRKTYERAQDLGVIYVNPRFKRRAYTVEEALDDCMFRCIDVVDPEHQEDGVIMKIEHEVRSVVKRDGSKYKSCPFNEIPKECSLN